MKQIPSESIDLIYIDPPFNTQTVRKSKAWDSEVQTGDFDDKWGGGYSSYILLKKSENIGRNVIDNFHKHLKKNGKGIIIAKSFGRGAKEEVARLRLEEGYDVALITIDDVLREAG